MRLDKWIIKRLSRNQALDLTTTTFVLPDFENWIEFKSPERGGGEKPKWAFVHTLPFLSNLDCLAESFSLISKKLERTWQLRLGRFIKYEKLHSNCSEHYIVGNRKWIIRRGVHPVNEGQRDGPNSKDIFNCGIQLLTFRGQTHKRSTIVIYVFAL